MLKFVILLCAFACVFGAAVPRGMLPQLDGRIVGGVESDIRDFPWQVSLQRGGHHFCGGSIYNQQIIVTAAHCVQFISASDIKVRAGSSNWNYGGYVLSVTSIRRHEKYAPQTIDNDIAVIKLAPRLTYSSTVKNIGLAITKPSNNDIAIVSGWGTTTYGSSSIPDQLKSVIVKIVSREVCASSKYKYGPSIKPSMICAYTVGKDACQGDSGGPLVSGGVLVGVVSWGEGCAFSRYPGVYADVAHLNSWVTSTANYI